MHWHCNISNLNINRSSSGSCFLERSRNTYLQDPRFGVVKELNIYIVKEDLSKLTDTLRNFNVSGMSFDEVQGAGRMKRREIRERDGWSVRTVTPEYEARIRVVTVVPDTLAEEIIDDVVNSMGSQNEPRGVIIVKEVSNVYEIGTKNSGDTILTHEHHIT
ncbi:MAG: P-II family nitrogen regulator [Nitrososphaeraceae archaeon]